MPSTASFDRTDEVSRDLMILIVDIITDLYFSLAAFCA